MGNVTIRRAGDYSVKAKLSISPVTDPQKVRVHLMRNSEAAIDAVITHDPTTHTATAVIDDIIKVVPGDVLSLEVYQNTGGKAEVAPGAELEVTEIRHRPMFYGGGAISPGGGDPSDINVSAQDEAQSQLDLLIDPGRATAEDLAELYFEISKIYRMMGGPGVDFRVIDAREPATEISQ